MYFLLFLFSFSFFVFVRACSLYCVHELLLGAVEDDDGEEEGDGEEGGAVEEATDGEGADTQTAVLEGLEDGGEGIDIEVDLVLGGGEAHGVDDRRGVHEELDAEADEHIEVAVFRGERGDDESPGHGVEADHHY